MTSAKEKVLQQERDLTEVQMWMIQVNETLKSIRDTMDSIYKLMRGDIPAEELLAPDVKTPDEVSRILEDRRKQKQEETPYLRRPRGPEPVN